MRGACKVIMPIQGGNGMQGDFSGWVFRRNPPPPPTDQNFFNFRGFWKILLKYWVDAPPPWIGAPS